MASILRRATLQDVSHCLTTPDVGLGESEDILPQGLTPIEYVFTSRGLRPFSSQHGAAA